MFKKILVCDDGSDGAMQAVQAAIGIAQKFESEALVVNVMPPVPVVAPYVISVEAAPDMAEVVKEAVEEQQATLSCAEHLFRKENIPVRTLAESGHAVEVITRVAEQEKADLIVLGSRGLGGFKRFLLGSVSDGVSHHAHCPVLIVR